MAKNVFKSDFGDKISYAECLKMSGLERLDQRRESRLKNFAIKAFTNPRFSGNWFPKKPAPCYDLRRREIILEEKTNTERLKCAPINKMCRLLNLERELP